MEFRIENLRPKKLIGKYLAMTFAENRTAELWKSFMLRRKEITNNLNTDLISMQVYDKAFDLKTFNPNLPFEKWAMVEVSDFDAIPEGMESFELPGGLYAVFLYKGDPRDAAPAFHYIFGTWLPNSEYDLDQRPHFEILDEKYKNNDPDSEEEIWIPIKPKA